MKAHLLCPGPSLALYDRYDEPVLRLGVNRAAAKIECEVWACQDERLFEAEQKHVLGRPLLLTAKTNHKRSVWRHVRLIDCPMLRQFCPLPLWPNYSATSALVYAASLGARSIEVFGMDWQGTLDWDGQSAGGNRSDHRWQHEREIFENLLVPWLAGRGVCVVRR